MVHMRFTVYSYFAVLLSTHYVNTILSVRVAFGARYFHILITFGSAIRKINTKFPFQWKISILPLQWVVMIAYFWLQVKPPKQVFLLSKHIEVTVAQTWVELHCEVLSNTLKCKDHFCSSSKKFQDRWGHHQLPV